MSKSKFVAMAFAAMVSVGSLSGCAGVMEKMDNWIAEGNRKTLESFPDHQLAAAFLTADGHPNGAYKCGPGCGMFPANDQARVDYILIEMYVMTRHHDQASMILDVARDPIENSEVGQIFIRNARSRGNFVAVYGAPVNQAIVRFTAVPQNSTKDHWYPSNISACLIEVDPHGGFVSILATVYDLSWGVIRTDLPESKDLFAQQRLMLFPSSTARLVQERMGAAYREDHRVR